MIVLDASVVIKWLLDEGQSRRALGYLEEHVSGVNPVVVPELLFYEVANVVATGCRLTPKESQAGLGAILDLELESHHLEGADYLRAVELAHKLGASVYDAAYVALAEKLSVPFVTADKKLQAKCSKLGWVQLLA